MRPDPDTDSAATYECFGCGRRAQDPDGRTCDRCGSTMRNIGAARDL